MGDVYSGNVATNTVTTAPGLIVLLGFRGVWLRRHGDGGLEVV